MAVVLVAVMIAVYAVLLTLGPSNVRLVSVL